MMQHSKVQMSRLILSTLIGLAACEGPQEQAGARQDEAAANAAGVTYGGSGSAEQIGQAQDRADAAARKSREARRKAVDAEGKTYQRQADVEAQKLEGQAKEIRKAADEHAEALKTDAAKFE